MGRHRRNPNKPLGNHTRGYCRPPPETQFPHQKVTRRRKATSPAPRDIATILDELLEAKVTIRDGARSRKVSRLEYLFMRAIDSAGKGDLRALKFVVEMRQRFPMVAAGEKAKQIEADDLALVADYLATLKDEGDDR